MIAGLLICDHVDDVFQAEFGDYPDMFKSLFPEFEWRTYDAQRGEYPEEIDSCDVYFATGSRHSVYEDLDWIIRLEQFIREIYVANKYFIGVCFGHQLMGKAMGGIVEKSSKGWCVGVHEFNIVEQLDWMVPNISAINLLMMCQDQVIDLPKESVLIASSEMCPNAMFQIGERFLGVQAHPEFSKEYDALLMKNRVDRMGVATVQKGMESLAKTVDKDLFRQWVLRFLAQ